MQYTLFSSASRRRRPGLPRRCKRPVRALASLLMGLMLPLPPCLARAAPLPTPDTRALRATSRGAVRGFVIDAGTRRPVSGAVVRIEEDGSFAPKGPTAARTDAAGRYVARARIGRSWRKIDWMRVFTSFPPLLLLRPQSATKQSRTILATRLNLRVEREGYRPFVGEVRCERLDAGRFAVQLDDIWLAPEGSALASFSPDHVRHERVESFTVEPAVARPGELVTITARARIPYERGGRYRVYFDSSEPRLVRSEKRLKPVGPPDLKTGLTTFQRIVRLPREPQAWTTELSPWISLNYHEIPVGWDRKVLLQVVRSDAEGAAAREVAAGYASLIKHDYGAAITTLQRATESAPSSVPACRYLGEAYAEAGRTQEAAAAFERLIALAPDDLEVALPRYASALLDGGRAAAAAAALESAAKQSKRVPGAVALARARLFARQGDLRAADEQLARAGRRGRIPRPVQREIALRRATAALKASPDSPDAELALARALGDVDRVAEAVRHAWRAHSLRPDEPWPLIEWAALERRLGRPEVARTALERALALDAKNGDAHLAFAEMLLADGQHARALELFRRAAERRPYDFKARHGLALAELRAGEPDAALNQLRAAAVMGRGKGKLDAGFEVPFGLLTTLYFDAKRHRIEGFARRDAADDYQLAEALQRLKQRPDDALAHFNAGTALARLGQPDLALASLDRAAALRPEIAELTYWRAVALVGLQQTAEARRALAETARQNPLHPHAHRALARLCLDAGELEQVQAHLVTHHRNWADEREREPEIEE